MRVSSGIESLKHQSRQNFIWQFGRNSAQRLALPLATIRKNEIQSI